ncbi:hypothetical protein D3C75_1064800 [compost metagenome]
MLDNLPDHTVQIIQNLLLRLPQCNLVGNLEEVAHRLAAFTINPSYGKAHLGDGLQDPVDLLGNHKSGKMDHYRGPDACSHIGGTAGQEPPPLIKCVFQQLLKAVIHLIGYLPGLPDLKA